MKFSNFKAIFAAASIFAIINGSDGFKRIMGGTVTNIEQVPYQVEIEIFSEGIYNHHCGGSLIRPDWIISAAHCFEAPGQYYIRAGVSNIKHNEGERRGIKQIRQIRPYYGTGSMGNIVLVQLKSPLPLSDKIRTIQLPPPSKGDVPLEMAIASGWGRSGYEDGQLRYANLPILDQRSCKNLNEGDIKEDMFCAGYAGSNPSVCNGDFGGPLALNGVLYGVVSFGSQLCNEIFGVFVKVPYYVQEINHIIANTR